jgi:hypothetical protein
VPLQEVLEIQNADAEMAARQFDGRKPAVSYPPAHRAAADHAVGSDAFHCYRVLTAHLPPARSMDSMLRHLDRGLDAMELSKASYLFHVNSLTRHAGERVYPWYRICGSTGSFCENGGIGALSVN